MNKDTLRQLSTWMGFVGIMTIIAGAFSAIAGLFAFIVGAIPGIITIILGVKLRNAKHNADLILAGETIDDEVAHFNMFTANLSTYFKIQGILIIISLAFALVGILIAIVGSVSMYMYQGF